MGKKYSALALGAMLALSAGTAFADSDNRGRGYGGHDDCRDGKIVIRDGRVKCENEHRDEHGNKGGHKDDDKNKNDNKGGKGSDDKKSNAVTTAVNQLVAMINKILGKKA